MGPLNDYIQEIMKSKPVRNTTNRFPDYGPAVEENTLV